MVDARRLVDALLSGGLASGFAGGVTGGLLGSALVGKRGRKFAKSAVRMGGLAVVGALAWQASRKYQTGQPAAGPGDASRCDEPPLALPASFDLTRQPRAAIRVVEAMIAAARADGSVDVEERRQIFGRLAEAELNASEQAFLTERLAAPVDLDALVTRVESQELALEMFTAAALTVVPPSPSEKAFLELLAARLGIEPALKQALDAEIALHTRPDRPTAANAATLTGDAA
jgi:uncharacterized membrane protein YebE (DUF533 family)